MGRPVLGDNVKVILTQEGHMTQLTWDRKAFWIYNGPQAASLDEVCALRDAGKLMG